jgi:ERF superfamily protein
MQNASVTMSDALNELAGALAAAQGEFPIIDKNRTAQLREPFNGGANGPREYKYADLADVLKGVLPVLSKHKLAVLQPTFVEAGHIFVRTRLVHASGQWIECEYPVCAVHVDHQRMGSALTYAKRYALCALLGVAADEDNDGVTTASGGAPKAAEREPGKDKNRAAREPRGRSAPVVRPTSGGNSLPPLVSRPVPSHPQRKNGGEPKAIAKAVPPLNANDRGTPNRHSQSDGG